MFKILNKDSFAISVVGLTGSFFGAFKRLPLCLPEIMRIVYPRSMKLVCLEKVESIKIGFLLSKKFMCLIY
ncbi:MAG: Uncharacterised protein [Polaribacter sp. SA4-10]|nr:MAG: Uncharacterised protein [Polaribacter sp. SA4-10]